MSSKVCQHFHSKLLLFGEYAIIKGGQGLAIPFPRFKGCLKIGEKKTDQKFFKLFDYLEKSPTIAKQLNLENFKRDLNEGLYFDSNIPQGYGIGSSGALCAAIFSEYCSEEIGNSHSSKRLKELQDYMALMESFYHGTSSGLDCLISLVDKPVYIKDRRDVETLEDPSLKKLGNFYLLDSGLERKTSPLVHKFLNKFESEEGFQNSFDHFSRLNDTAIKLLLSHNNADFVKVFEELSSLQLDLFAEMVPENIRAIWREGLEQRKFYTKLCGAGGGGFFLIYSHEKLNLPGLIEI